jgi:hypothetical protein
MSATFDLSDRCQAFVLEFMGDRDLLFLNRRKAGRFEVFDDRETGVPAPRRYPGGSFSTGPVLFSEFHER